MLDLGRKIGLRLARTRVGNYLYRKIASKMKIKFPLAIERETKIVSVFYHPDPEYPFHLLIVPKKEIESIHALEEMDGELLVQLFVIVKRIVVDYGLEEVGYRLILNGGKNQLIPQLHFHLIAENCPSKHPDNQSP